VNVKELIELWKDWVNIIQSDHKQHCYSLMTSIENQKCQYTLYTQLITD